VWTKHVDIVNKQAWNISNYRYVGDVSTTKPYFLTCCVKMPVKNKLLYHWCNYLKKRENVSHPATDRSKRSVVRIASLLAPFWATIYVRYSPPPPGLLHWSPPPSKLAMLKPTTTQAPKISMHVSITKWYGKRQIFLDVAYLIYFCK
jgi:hypothetical protein